MKHRWPSTLCCRLSALAAILLLNAAGSYTTNAADGPAPSSQQRRVVSGVHADAISVFAENGGLTLGSKADVDGSLGVRLDPNLTAFNVEQSRRTTIPNAPSYAFLGTPGSDVWIAPESNPGAGALWPGFSTEGIPTGVLDGNQLTLRLEAVSGPGTLHVFQSDTFGNPVRRFSSTGTEFREWNLPRGTHAHANWAFSATGSYTLTFIASALTNGVSISATQNYTFVVGTVPAAVATTTTLAASTNNIVGGSPVSLSATVVPKNAVGYLEFKEGGTILGHVANVTGSATLTTANLLLGARSVTARFIPQWLNDFSASTSAPVAITVTDESGVPFSITGVGASYQVGDLLKAQTAGYTLGENDQFGFQVRPIGANEDPATCCSTWLGEVDEKEIAAGHLTLTADLGWDGYEIRAVAREGVYNEEEDYWTYNDVAFTSWVPISVAHPDDVDPISTMFPSSAYEGDEIALPLSRPLAEGESVRVAYREWSTLYSWPGILYPTGREATVVDNRLVTTIPWGAFNHPEWLTKYAFAIQVIRAGLVVAQSEPTLVPLKPLELLIEGLLPVYRVGDTLDVTATVYPPRDEFRFRWATFNDDFQQVVLSEGPDGSFEMPLDLSWNDRYLFVQVVLGFGLQEQIVANVFPTIVVSDADPDEQVFFFATLAGHYHQGDNVNLSLTVAPDLSTGDEITWEWKWPGQDWAPFPGVSGKSHQLKAEQALDGVPVRATLDFAGDDVESVVAEPVTIFVDDHGAVARQQPTVAGVTSYTAGQEATLTRQLPANGATILTTHRWERKAAGASEFFVIPGATNPTLNFPTTLADHGAQYRVSILKPGGAVAYGPSPAVALTVSGLNPVPFAMPAYHGDTLSIVFLSVTGDFNGDGHSDKITSGNIINTLAYLQGTGDGGFLPAQLLNSGLDVNASGLAAIDYDGDGDLDLVATEANDATAGGAVSEGTITLYRNNGTGAFSRVVLKSGLKTGQGVAAGDFNGDGRPDVAWCTFGSDPATFSVNGTFDYSLQTASGELGAVTSLSSNYGGVVRAQDFNEDGNMDLLTLEKAFSPVTFEESNELRIRHGKGDGTFAAAQLISAIPFTEIEQIVDLNGDGRLDVLVLDSSNAGYFPQQPDGRFGARVSILSDVERALGRLHAADINQDGVLDIASHFHGGALGSGLVPSIFWIPGQGGGAYGTPVFVAYHNASVYSVEVLDLDGDSHPDIVASGKLNPAVPGTVIVYLNQTGENPMLLTPPAAGSRIAGDPIDLEVYFGFPITVTGTPRIALNLGGNTVYANYQSGSGLPTLTFRYMVTAADLDLDGVQLASNRIDLNGGTLTDPVGGAGVLEFPNLTFSGVIANGSGPLVQMISRVGATPTEAATVRFAVQFAEDVTGVDVSDFTARMTEGNLSGAAVVSVTGSGSLYEVTVSTGTGSGALGLSVNDAASIHDLGGAMLGKGYAGGEVYTMRKAPIGIINTYYTHGHADFRPLYSNGEFSFLLNPDDNLLPNPTYPSEQIIAYLDSTAIVNRAAASAYDFIGVGAGEPLYVSRASGGGPTVPFLGYSGEGLIPGTFPTYLPADSRISSAAPQPYLKVAMVGMRSSSGGQFSLYSTSGLDPVIWMASSDGFSSTDNIWLYEGAHTHLNTAFSKPGTYEIDVVISGYLDSNGNGTLDPLVDTYAESGIKTIVWHVEILGAQDDLFTLVDGNTLNGDVSLNDDWHEAMGAYMASVQTEPANGILTLNTNGSFTYVPNAGFSGTDGFVYRVTNERGGFTTGTATIIVRPAVHFLVHRIGLTNSASSSANKINDRGQITGTVDGTDGVSRGYLFETATGREIERAGYPGSDFTEWGGITSSGTLAGYYADPADPTFGTYRAFTRDSGGNYTAITWSGDPDFGFTVDIDEHGRVAGGGNNTAWVWNPNGTFTVFNVPGFQVNGAFGMNDHGIVVGAAWPGFFDTPNGLIYNLTNNTATIWNYPGAAQTTLYGINNRGDIVGEFKPNLTSANIPFVRWADGSTQILEFPGLPGARVYDINDDRTVVGRYKDAANKNRSFYATPNAFAAAKAYTLGHGDIRPVYTNGTLHLIYNLSVGAVVDGVDVGTFEERERGVDFAATELRTVIPNVPMERPEEDLWDFLGTTAGQPVWLIPEVSEPDRPWLGFSTESLTRSDWQDGLLQLELVSFSGPPGGHFALFQNDGITNFVHFQTVDGVDTNDVYRTQGLTGAGFPAQIHAHANWTFTRPGSYQVGLRFSGQHLTDGRKEGTAVFLIEVVRSEPTLSLARADDGSVTLSFPTEAGSNYVLQRRDQLEASAWSEVEFIPGTGQVIQTPVSTSKTSGFYRVIIE